MKNIIVLTAFFLSLCSCSDDDTAQNITQREPLVAKITIETKGEPDKIYDITYDEQNRIEKIVYDGRIMNYNYNDKNYIRSVFYDAEPFVFNYNAQNIVTSYEFGDTGEANAVTYNADTNSYRFPPNNYTLNDRGDVAFSDDAQINYTDAKGIFANVTGENIHLMHYFMGNLSFIGSKMGIKNVVDENNQKLYEMETHYNDSGYPFQIDMISYIGDGNQTITLEY